MVRADEKVGGVGMAVSKRVDTLPSDIETFRHAAGPEKNECSIDRRRDGVFISELTIVEIFTFSDGEGMNLSFNVRGIKDAMVEGKLPYQMCEAGLTQDWYDHILRSSGVEEKRLKALTDADLERPGLMILWGGKREGFTTLVDGNHRLVRRWQNGLRTFRHALVPMCQQMFPFICIEGNESKFFPDRKIEGVQTLHREFAVLDSDGKKVEPRNA